MLDVALATCTDHPDLNPFDRGLVPALRSIGLSAAPAVWSDPDGKWAEGRAVVIQSTWDCHVDPRRFLGWARQVEQERLLLNPVRTIEPNLHKGYLRDLAERGAPVTPTLWVDRGGCVDLAGAMETRGWSRAVVKPAVSASAHETHIVRREEAAAGQDVVDRLLRSHDLLVQPYLEAFETEGERSFIFFDRHFSHAVRRPPTLASAARGYDRPARIDPDPAELDLARSVMALLDEVPLHARVDLARGNDGVMRLQELELIEPCLFTSLAPGSAQAFARAVAGRL